MTYSDFKTQYAISLNPQQEAAVQAVEGPVLLLAVPGSGKTTVLVTRLGYMVLCKGIPPERILTMTYTVAATADMRSRFAALFGQTLADRLEFRTINGVSARIIRHYEQSLGRKAFDLVTDERELTALTGEILRRVTGEYATDSTVKTVRTWITYIKNMELSDAEIDRLKADDIEIGPVYLAYCQALRQRRRMDYDDQMVYACRILRQYPEILQYFQTQYPYLCVDEAQDTSKIQHRIIRLLARGRENLFLVGDEDQSIYGFRAAYPEALLEFDRVHPGAKVLLLERNYRSTAQIVEAANRFIRENRSRRPKHMTAVRGSGPNIRVVETRDRRGQYAYLEKVARSCQTEQVETAVLYRNNDSALPLIDLMSRAGIGYRCRQFDSSFFTHRVVRDISDIIRFAYEPENGGLFLGIYYKLGAGIPKAAAEAAARQGGEDILDALTQSRNLSAWSCSRCKALKTHFGNLRQERADKAVYRIVHFMGYGDYLKERNADAGKIPILEALGASEPNPRRLLARLEELSVIVQEGAARQDSQFILSTIHSSKGLEYQRVYLMDVVDGILPTCPAVPPTTEDKEALGAYEEERRLFYVGMTRARQELILFRLSAPELSSVFVHELFPEPVRSKPRLKPAPRKPDPPPVRSAAQREQLRQAAAEFEPGARVTHKAFGPGVIADRNGDIVTILCDSGQVKRVSLQVSLEGKLLKRGEPA